MSPAALHAITPLGWPVIAGSAAFAVLGGYTGLCFWTGRRIVPWTPVETMDQIRVLGVTLLPAAVTFAAWFLIGIVSRIGAHVHTDSSRLAVDVVMILLGLVSLVAFAIATSLFFFTRPRRFVPPRYRRR